MLAVFFYLTIKKAAFTAPSAKGAFVLWQDQTASYSTIKSLILNSSIFLLFLKNDSSLTLIVNILNYSSIIFIDETFILDNYSTTLSTVIVFFESKG